MQDRRGAWCEAALTAVLFALPPLLALASRGAAALATVAGLAAAGLVAARPPLRLRRLTLPGLLLALLVAWGAASAAWSLIPGHSLALAFRVLALFAAALALAASAAAAQRPERLLVALLAGGALGIALAAIDFASGGVLSSALYTRPYRPAELNQITAAVAILTLPAAAALWCHEARVAAIATLAAGLATVALLVDDSAKAGLILALPVAGLVWWRRGAAARGFATLSAVAIMTVPWTLPRLAGWPHLFAAAKAFRLSLAHRLLIWAFAGAHIIERPGAGWGLDASRAIPGGKVEVIAGGTAMPLHPHDAALQVWLELGVPGAVLFAGFVALLWRRIADADWPPLYAAAAAGSLTAALAVAFSAYGIWQEWWLGTLALCAFAVLALGRTATDS
ncbi:MAG TPA: O-antigen ligase family protein [Stellaceae bacterium]|nr:O-antigen ligase family protein [Stellaceae bacterium]